MDINQLYTVKSLYSSERVRSEYSINEIQLDNRSRSNCWNFWEDSNSHEYV